MSKSCTAPTELYVSMGRSCHLDQQAAVEAELWRCVMAYGVETVYCCWCCCFLVLCHLRLDPQTIWNCLLWDKTQHGLDDLEWPSCHPAVTLNKRPKYIITNIDNVVERKKTINIPLTHPLHKSRPPAVNPLTRLLLNQTYLQWQQDCSRDWSQRMSLSLCALSRYITLSH